MTEPRSSRPKPAEAHEDPVSLHKIGLIAGLALATLVPKLFISGLIEERETRQGGVQGVREQLGTAAAAPKSDPGRAVPACHRPRQYLKIPARRLIVRQISIRRSAGAACSTPPCTTPRSRCRASSSSRARSDCGRPHKAGRCGTKVSSHSRDQLHRSAIGGSHRRQRQCDAMDALPGIRRRRADCRGASLVLASAPLAAAATSVAFKSAMTLRGTGSFGVDWAGKELGAVCGRPGRRRASAVTSCRRAPA